MPELRFRDLHTADEFRQVMDLEAQVWGFTDLNDMVTLPVFTITVKRGAILIGAYDERDRMVGFVYSIVGMKPGRQVLQWSHMLGVLPEYRNSGLGRALKLAQRDKALAQGYELIEWTYDPLQAMNAHLNFTKLGVVAEEYHRNVYGESTSVLHKGTPTDRLVAQWCQALRPRASWVPCAQAESDSDIHLAIARALSWPPAATALSLAPQLRRLGPAVLVLDSADRIEDLACLEPLLEAAPDLRVIATTTTARGGALSRVLRLEGLERPAQVALYRALRGEDEGTLPIDLEETDGLPLAIALAAEGGSPLGEPLLAAFERAIERLCPASRQILASSTVFRAPFPLVALEEVSGGAPEQVRELIDRSLLARVDSVALFRPYRAVREIMTRSHVDLSAPTEAHARWYSARAKIWLTWWRTDRQDELRQQTERACADLKAAGDLLAARDPDAAAPIAELMAVCPWLAEPSKDLLWRLVRCEEPYPSFGQMCLVWIWRHERQRAAALDLLARARAAGVSEEDWRLRALSAQLDEHLRDLGGCPSDPRSAVDWMSTSAAALLAQGQIGEGFALLQQAAARARRSGDRIGRLGARSAEAASLWLLEIPGAKRAEIFEGLSAEWEAEGEAGEAAQAAILAAYAASMDEPRAGALARRAEALARASDDERVISRAALVGVWLAACREDPRVILERADALAAGAAAQGDRGALARARALSAFAVSLIDGSEPSYTFLALPRSSPPEDDRWMSRLAALASRHLGRPEPDRVSIEADPFLSAVEALYLSGRWT